MLNVDKSYDIDTFIEEIALVMQSNDDSIGDDEMEFIVTVAQNRCGGSRLSLGHVPYDERLLRKGSICTIQTMMTTCVAGTSQQ